VTLQGQTKTNCVVVGNIRFVGAAALARRLRLRPESGMMQDLTRLVNEAHAVARPKAVYRLAFVEETGTDHVVIDGLRFSSRVLRVNLQDVQRVFLYVATCGVELGQWYGAQENLLYKFWAETIAELALRVALKAVRREVVRRYQPGPLSTMNPGSLTDWPLEEQRWLFQLLGNTEESVGVRLTESMLMLPVKSVSGILFETESRFQSCQLCPRERCRERRAPYDAGLMEGKYGSGS
jgi:hypothetical protein